MSRREGLVPPSSPLVASQRQAGLHFPASSPAAVAAATPTADSPRASSPFRATAPMPPRGRSRSPAQQQAHATAVSPFRNIFLPRDVHSRESRLLNMMSDFASHTSFRLSQRLEEITASVRRTHYMSPEDANALMTLKERNECLMTNVEHTLGDAVDQHESMERNVVKRCHIQWSKCNAQNKAIDDLLARYGKKYVPILPGSRRPSPAPSVATFRATSPASQLMRTASSHPPADAVAAFDRVESLRSASRQEVQRSVSLTRLDSSQASMVTVPSGRRGVSPVGRTAVIDDPASVLRARFMQRSLVTAEDAKEAQRLFVAHFGQEKGQAQFLQWLYDLPMDTLRALQTQLVMK